MFPIIEIPEIVQHYAHHFSPIFSTEAWIQFQRYVSGLIVSENKTVEGINRLIVYENRNQSSLNRLLTTDKFSEQMLNQHRLELLQSMTGTQFKEKGVLSLDDTHLIHYGSHFDEIAYLWDPVEKRYAPSHNLVTLHYSDDQTDYPVNYQLWKPANLQKIEDGLMAIGIPLKEAKFELKKSDPKKWRNYLLGVWRRNQNKPEVADLYASKLAIARQQVTQFCEAYPDIKLPVTFDSWYTQPAFCRYLDQVLKVPYVGTLKPDHEFQFNSGRETVDSFVKRLKQEHLDALAQDQTPLFRKITIRYKGEKEVYYTYCRTLRVHNFGKHRVVINFSRADLSDTPRIFISNRLHWQAAGITRIRRHRWPVEVYHQEGKAEGLDQYQVRDFQAISKHIGLVAVTYSLLRAASHDLDLQQKLQRQLKYDFDDSRPTSLRRVTQAQALWTLASLIATKVSLGQSLEEVLSPLLASIYI